MENENSKWFGMRVTDILFEKGVLTRTDRDLAIESEKSSHRTAKSYLIEHHLASEQQIAECLALKHGLPFLPDSEIRVSVKRTGNALKLIPYSLALRERFIPIDFDAKKNILSIVAREPIDEKASNHIRTRIPGVVLRTFIGQESTILKLVYNYSRNFYHPEEIPAEPAVKPNRLRRVMAAVIVIGICLAAGFYFVFAPGTQKNPGLIPAAENMTAEVLTADDATSEFTVSDPDEFSVMDEAPLTSEFQE